MSSSADLIQAGRAALEEGDAATARSRFEEAVRMEESAEALEGLALADHLDAAYDAAADKFERAFGAYREQGDIAGAARCGRMLMWILGNLKGNWALESGWAARLRNVLAEAPDDSAEHGWLLCLGAQASDDETSAEELKRALAIARATRDRALEYETLAWMGLTSVLSGRVKEGMAVLDAALTAVFAGEVTDVYVMEGTFCGMLWACEAAHDIARAALWMRAVEDMRRRRSLPAMAAFCRIHHGAILTAAGRWPEAERELTQALRMFEGSGTRMQAKALIQLADLRIRQGRLEEAERLLDGLDRHPDATRSLAALHFGKGNLALARDVIKRGVGEQIETCDDESLLALFAEIAIATGETDDAARASKRIDQLAAQRGGHYLNALAALVRGQICLAGGDERASTCLDEALAYFSQTEMPLELARARLILAEAAATERPELAIEEAKAALAAFERLEAARYADRAGALLRRLGAPARTGIKGYGALTKREAEVLDLLGTGMSNPEIAERLFITRRTVEHHVASVLAKLMLRNRAEAAAFAVRKRGMQ
jgi:DNA-binding CsgD family transcriptional regulator/Tfp pilus assembly protein PilF